MIHTALTREQIDQYEKEGYLVLRNAISEQDIIRLERGVKNNPPLDGTLDPNAPIFPSPGRYTLATQAPADPDLGFIIEHPTIVQGATDLLGEDVVLTAYVIYDRTPQGNGLGPHHDYKRWRPVGSSMHWLFTIVPFCDFDEHTGQLFVAPGSHHLERLGKRDGVIQEINPAIKPHDQDFIDPGLQRGDLLFMNMHLWHRAAPNLSDQHRVGLFNKYAAASYPPATGYYLFNSQVAKALSPAGQKLLAIHSDRSILTTRCLLTRKKDNVSQIYLQEDESGTLCLPGGRAWDERAIPDWDLGNYIAPAQQYLRDQVQVEVPWLSYVGDYEEAAGLCRLYGYELNNNGFPVRYPGQWVSADDLARHNLGHDWLGSALKDWQRTDVVRGKGISQAAARIDQFAY